MKIRIGTRKSKLAMWQADWVAQRIRSHNCEVEIVPIETKGDKVLNVSIHKIGDKGVFTEELEQLLANHEIDIAVHSAKDLPSKIDAKFELIAFSEREKVNDVLVSRQKFIDLNSPDVVIGTSSTRRRAFFQKYYPHIRLVDMRGNLQTRIDKMDKGACDAMVLAYAGMHRMGYDELIVCDLAETEFIPAVGQGSLGIECLASISDEKKSIIRKAINDPDAEMCITAERSFLAKMDGGCSVPVFGHCHKENGFVFHGGILSLDGQQTVIINMTGSDPVKLGEAAALGVLSQGGDTILLEIKKTLNKI